MRTDLLFLHCVRVLLLLTSPKVLHAIPLSWITTSVDEQTQNVLFTLQFRGVPDFFAVDAFDRQQDSFQLYILDQPHNDLFRQPQPDGGAILRSVVRGSEINFSSGLPIRDALPIVFDPTSGGWGSTVEIIPFVQSGENVSFIASFSTLRLTGNPPFGLGFETFHFGATENFNYQCASGTVCFPVPEPDMLSLTLVGIVCIALVRRYVHSRLKISRPLRQES